ncbi:MAG: hypothetical protein H0T62_07060 [Parachlamydiaceae bacterium]|nr:hypothetical protein [Parachlamydiaceae bacterium]
MNIIRSDPYSNSMDLQNEQLNSCIDQQSEIQFQTGALAMVCSSVPVCIPVRVWPNLHSLFTLATFVANIACLVFPNPITIGINVTIRCASIAFAIYASNKTKIGTDIFSIAVILIVKNAAISAIAADLIFEGINLSRCEVSCDFLKTKFTSFFKPKKKPLDISRFLKVELRDTTILENARKALGVPLDKIDDQNYIDIRYNGRNRQTLLNRKRDLDAIESPLAAQVQLQINYRDTAYKTLTERNKANLI